MPLIYACIAPHAGDLIPETVEDQKVISTTRESMYRMGATLQSLAPDVIVLINPHGFRVHGALSASVAECARADWAPDVKLDFEMDTVLAHAMADRAIEMNLPVVKYIYGASGGFHPIDWARLPLYSGTSLAFKPKLVPQSHADSSFGTHYDPAAAGRSSSALRIAVVAS
jgi:aromatic ring-opening dioxygenase LigB subunit